MDRNWLVSGRSGSGAMHAHSASEDSNAPVNEGDPQTSHAYAPNAPSNSSVESSVSSAARGPFPTAGAGRYGGGNGMGMGLATPIVIGVRRTMGTENKL